MDRNQVAVSARNAAPAARVCQILADYREHARMLERFVSRRVLPPIYVAELKEIERYAVANPVAPEVGR